MAAGSSLFRMRARFPHILDRLAEADDHGARAAGPRGEASLVEYDRLLGSEADIADVPADLLRAICWFGSGWRQFDPTGRVLATPAAQGTSFGCMQLNDVWHPDAFPAAKTDAVASVRYAAKLLRWLYEQTGDWERATTAFFGHDRRAENAARRVRKYARLQPWRERLGDAPDPADAPAPVAVGTDLYAEL